MTPNKSRGLPLVQKLSPPPWLLRLVAASVLVTLVVGAMFLRAESEQVREHAAQHLRTTAEYKASEILRWFDMHRKALTILQSDGSFGSSAAAIASGVATPADEDLVRDRLASFKTQDWCERIWISDTDGNPVFTPYSADSHTTPALRDTMLRALETREVAFSSIHRLAPGEPPHFDFVVPLLLHPDDPAAALIVASVHADEFVYPLVTTWPTESASAETLLLERDGDTAKILTPLRLADDAPLTKSIPLAGDSVEGRAVSGAGGMLEGRDYRGTRVIAYAQELEGTQWVLLAKIDLAEAMADARSAVTAWLVVIALIELTIIGASFGLWSRWLAKRRREDAERLSAVLDVLRSEPGSTHDLLSRVLHVAMGSTGSPAGAVYRYDPERDLMRPEVRLSESSSPPRSDKKRSPGWMPASKLVAWAEPVRSGKPFIINRNADEVLKAHSRPHRHIQLHTFLAVPVIVDGRPVAVVGLANRDSGYDEHDAAELALVFEAAWHEVERIDALEELRALNAELEQRVQERTAELAYANEELQAQSEELAASNEELAAANEELLAQAEELNAANRELAAQAEQLEEQTLALEQQAEKLAEASEAKTRFLRTMSHELRTPLNSIIGFTELLLQGLAGPLNEEQRKQLSMVNASGHHLLTLVNDLLDLSRIEAGAVVLSREHIDVAGLVREVMETVRPAAEAKGLAIGFEIPEPAPSLTSDKTRVRQILLNLLDNAIKFTESGSVSLTVSRDGHRTVSFTVKDTGPGIPKEHLEDIFRNFVRLQDGGAREGTGLGLAIARHLASALGGSLIVKSSLREGSAFMLTLPQQ